MGNATGQGCQIGEDSCREVCNADGGALGSSAIAWDSRCPSSARADAKGNKDSVQHIPHPSLMNRELLLAAQAGDHVRVRVALLSGADVQSKQPIPSATRREGETEDESRCESGPKITPLMCAAQEGHLKVVAVLLQARAFVNDESDDGRRPLHFAAGEGCYNVCCLLIHAAADTSALDCTRRSAYQRYLLRSEAKNADRWKALLNPAPGSPSQAEGAVPKSARDLLSARSRNKTPRIGKEGLADRAKIKKERPSNIPPLALDRLKQVPEQSVAGDSPSESSLGSMELTDFDFSNLDPEEELEDLGRRRLEIGKTSPHVASGRAATSSVGTSPTTVSSHRAGSGTGGGRWKFSIDPL